MWRAPRCATRAPSATGLRHGKFNVTQGKNFDASGSIGPWLVTADEIDLTKPLHLTVKVNGEITQDDTTASMIKSFSELIAYVSTFMTLKPGDIIVTGTPVKLGPRGEPPALAQTGRRGGDRSPADRRAAQQRGGGSMSERTQSGLHHRLAGGPFALAADPQLLDQAAQSQRRIPARGGAAGKIRRVRHAICASTAISAPTSRCRTSRPRWRCRSRTSARARSAPPIRCGTTATRCARPIPTSKASSPISTPPRRAGTAGWKPPRCWAPAAARARWCSR